MNMNTLLNPQPQGETDVPIPEKPLGKIIQPKGPLESQEQFYLRVDLEFPVEVKKLTPMLVTNDSNLHIIVTNPTSSWSSASRDPGVFRTHRGNVIGSYRGFRAATRRTWQLGTMMITRNTNFGKYKIRVDAEFTRDDDPEKVPASTTFYSQAVEYKP
ncbi:Uu.00g053270.m01.CDS01 [Anthostomella pinea]|uniref:Uu.00g053270.m01.CDS01 n=1 Tax=Anthostomella pinea TaxID=933095 RepID=A0AAI8VWF3_9PEZI|nr:Uu.00g053270.m01.CDS01 [Anthostomella pinea]